MYQVAVKKKSELVIKPSSISHFSATSPKLMSNSVRSKKQASDREYSEEGQDKLSRKKAKESYASKAQQNRSIYEQVKHIDKTSHFQKQQVQELQNKIVATLESWELFSDDQVSDVNKALKMLIVQMHLGSEEQLALMQQLGGVVSSNDAPMHIRIETTKNLYQLMKNRKTVSYLLDDRTYLGPVLSPFYAVLNDNGLATIQSNCIDQMSELQQLCCQILLRLLCLNNRKFYIPGETSQKAKMRQRAMDLGILIVLLHVFLNTPNPELKNYLQDEFVDRLEEQDIEYHFTLNHSHYEKLSSVVTNCSYRQAIDDYLSKRLKFLVELRERDLKLQLEKRRGDQEREI